LNLRPPGYETCVARSGNIRNRMLWRCSIGSDQLRSPQVGKSLGKGFFRREDACAGERHITSGPKNGVRSGEQRSLRSRSDQIAEQRGDNLPFVPGNGRLRRQRTATRTAEAETVRVLLSASGTRRHKASVRQARDVPDTAFSLSRSRRSRPLLCDLDEVTIAD